MRMITLIYILLLASITIPTSGRQPIDVTMVQLIANPEKFDGKLVRVIGFLRLEFEGDALYLHREDYEISILGNGIWVDATPEINKQSKILNMHYVLLEGTFSAKDRGHMGMWSGALKHITRCEVWPFEKPASPHSP
jgi:hypothetical protein